jgi:hypothetical protein
MQALGGVREEITVLMHGAPLHRHAIPNGGNGALKPGAAINPARPHLGEQRLQGRAVERGSG